MLRDDVRRRRCVVVVGAKRELARSFEMNSQQRYQRLRRPIDDSSNRAIHGGLPDHPSSAILK
jgi:hypothetical protein